MVLGLLEQAVASFPSFPPFLKKKFEPPENGPVSIFANGTSGVN
jgi:hypothetical protein